MKRIQASFIVIVILLISSCITKNQKIELKELVLKKYPTFETEAKEVIRQKYGDNIYKKLKWEWKFEEEPKKHEYIVKYGCFRDLSFVEEVAGGVVEDMTSELTLKLVSYNPLSSGKGIYYKFKVNTKEKTVELKK